MSYCSRITLEWQRERERNKTFGFLFRCNFVKLIFISMIRNFCRRFSMNQLRKINGIFLSSVKNCLIYRRPLANKKNFFFFFKLFFLSLFEFFRWLWVHEDPEEEKTRTEKKKLPLGNFRFLWTSSKQSVTWCRLKENNATTSKLLKPQKSAMLITVVSLFYRKNI